MSKPFQWFSVFVAAASLAAPLSARADVAAACSMAVDYLVNANLVEAYRRDFVVQEGVPFVDDFGSVTRLKQFTASVTKAGGNLTVAIDFFADVSALNSTEFNTSLTVRGGGSIESTFSNQTFSTSTASGFSRHATNYTLACRKV